MKMHLSNPRISMMVMKQMGIYEILTHDKHFTQEGLTILF